MPIDQSFSIPGSERGKQIVEFSFPCIGICVEVAICCCGAGETADNELADLESHC